MMKIIFNQDGSIESITIPESIQQGNDGVDEIFVKWNGYSNTDYTCDAVFTLPNGDTNTLVATTSGSGFLITLTEAQTLYAGKLLASFRLKDLNTTLFSYQYEFQINPTGADIDETTITIAQYNSIVQAMNSYLLLDGGTLNDGAKIELVKGTSSSNPHLRITNDDDPQTYGLFTATGLLFRNDTATKTYTAQLKVDFDNGTTPYFQIVRDTNIYKVYMPNVSSYANGTVLTLQKQLYRHTLSMTASGGYGLRFEVINDSDTSLTINGYNASGASVFAASTSTYKNFKYVGTSASDPNKLVAINHDNNGLKIKVFKVESDGTLSAEATTPTLTDSVVAL